MGRPAPTPDISSSRSPQDFYTCVQLMDESGEVHLVPCLPAAYCGDFPPFPRCSPDEKERKKKLTDYQTLKNVMNDRGEAERSEAAAPLLPVAADG